MYSCGLTRLRQSRVLVAIIQWVGLVSIPRTAFACSGECVVIYARESKKAARIRRMPLFTTLTMAGELHPVLWGWRTRTSDKGDPPGTPRRLGLARARLGLTHRLREDRPGSPRAPRGLRGGRHRHQRRLAAWGKILTHDEPLHG